MAPEQMRGKSAITGPTSSLGVTFYEMLTGRPAFGGETTIERLTAILKENPPALPAGGVASASRSCRPPLPREEPVAAVPVRQGTSRSPWRRCRPRPRPRRRRGPGTGRRAANNAEVAAAGWRGSPSWAMSAIGAVAMRQAAPARSGVVSFEARTFDRLPITNARFMPDGQTIVYSATRERICRRSSSSSTPPPKRRSRSGCRTRTCCRCRARASWPSSRPRGSSISASTAARWPA